MSKIDGKTYKGKKYSRSTDYKRDYTKTIIRKANAKIKEQQEIIDILKARKARAAKAGKKLILKADLLVIDDLMMFPLDKNLANLLFNLINYLHEKASVIITTNKSPKQWAKILDDEVLATAILDRLLYRCQIIKLNGDSYRLKNRKSIF